MVGAHGLAFENTMLGARLMPFARGGVFNSPFFFPLAGGGVGVGSEYGQHEAVMPLARTRSGDLGVKAAGGGVEIHIHNNTNATASVQETTSSSGEKRIDVIIDDMQAKNLVAGKSARVLRDVYGLKPMLTMR